MVQTTQPTETKYNQRKGESFFSEGAEPSDDNHMPTKTIPNVCIHSGDSQCVGWLLLAKSLPREGKIIAQRGQSLIAWNFFE